jgi:hypothetical protein
VGLRLLRERSDPGAFEDPSSHPIRHPGRCWVRTRPLIRTDESTIELIRRLAARYPDAQIAGILNRQHRRTAKGSSCTPARVQTLRFRNDIPGRRPSCDPQEGELLTVAGTARELGLAPSTVHRWLNDGFIRGEQLTPGAPWRIRLTDDIRALLAGDTPGGWLATLEATHVYGLSRQTLLQRVKRSEIRAVYLRTGRKRACVSRLQPRKKGCSNPQNQQGSSVIMHPKSQ